MICDFLNAVVRTALQLRCSRRCTQDKFYCYASEDK